MTNSRENAVTPERIRAAADLINGKVVRTPTVYAGSLSSLSGAEVSLKLENLQYTGSFKARGAYVRLSELDDAARTKGVIAASAGNHAQGVAYHARAMGIPATIVMPRETPFTKVVRTEALGAKIILEGETLAESTEHAVELCDRDNLSFIHPYDDDSIISGQGTIGLELMADMPDLDSLIVPIGGGGLISGIAIAALSIKPDLKIYGVEADLYPSMHGALQGKDTGGGGNTIADGIAVKNPGVKTRAIIDDTVEEIFLVDEAQMEKAILTYMEHQRIVVEGAGAASLAALLANRDTFAGQKVGLLVSGGNIDSRILSSILMRGLVRTGRLARLRIVISDTPGVLAIITGLIGDSGANIIEVYHQRLFYDIPVKQAELDVVVETLDISHVQALVEKLTEAGYPAKLLSATSVPDSGEALSAP